MKHLIMFSGGAGSAFEAKLTIDKYGKDNVILLHTPTYSEHKTADVFRERVSNYLDIPITVQQDGRDLWKCIEDNNCLPSQFIPFCTQQLKINQTDKYLKNTKDKLIIHYGFGVKEWRRVQKVYARLLSKGYETEFILHQSNLENDDIKKIIIDEWKIELPEPYKYLEHNNCIPCFKAGKSYFEKVYKYYPEQYLKAELYEDKIGHTVFKDISLKQLRKKIENTRNQISLFQNEFNVPCECWN